MFFEKLTQIGWLEEIAFGGYFYHPKDFIDQFWDKEGDVSYLSLAEGYIDEEEFDLEFDTKALFRIVGNDLDDEEKTEILAKRYASPNELFKEINQILKNKHSDKAFFLLPTYENFFYIYKPSELYKKAIQQRLIPMNKTVKAVLFDLDGTLIDTVPDFIRIIKAMCAKYNRPVPSDEAIRAQVSAGARAMVKLMFGEKLHNVPDDNPTLLVYRQEFLDMYEADICVDSKLFDDNLLYELEAGGVPWGIVTNKPRYLAEILLGKLNLTERCSVLVCPDDVKHTKPDAEPMFLAVKILNEKLGLNLTPQDCVYVGDHIRDIEAGNNAGMVTILASYGYIPPQDQADLSAWGADIIVNDTDALYKTVCSLVFNKGKL